MSYPLPGCHAIHYIAQAIKLQRRLKREVMLARPLPHIPTHVHVRFHTNPNTNLNVQPYANQIVLLTIQTPDVNINSKG